MRIGVSIISQNYGDWDRFEAEERGENAPESPAVPDQQIFREELALAIEADRLGFDSVWTVEHHFTPYTMITNPLQYLTYVAGVTEHVDLGTMVTVLPWHHPVRVVEDVSMLQAFLGDRRRVIAGVGRGLARREFRGLGLDQSEARGLFDESLQIVRNLLRDGGITFHGERFQLDNVRLRPQPGCDLSDRLWCAAGSPETLDITAKHNVQPLIIPTQSVESALEGVRYYMRLRDGYGFGPTETKLALWAYVGETGKDAREGAEYMGNFGESGIRHYELHTDYHKNVKGYQHYAAYSEALRGDPSIHRKAMYEGHPWGTAEQVIEKITSTARDFGATEIMCMFRYGGMPLDQAQASLRRFARDVLPALHALEIEPLTVSTV